MAQITHPDDLNEELGRAELVLAGHLPHYTIEKRYIRKDGTPVWASMFGKFIFDDKRPVQGIAVAVDITTRKLADLALHENRQRLLLAHEAAGLGSFDWNVPADVVTWDTRAREIWGFPAGIALDRAMAMTGIHPDDRATVAHALDQALDSRTGGRYCAAFRVIHATDGRTRWAELRGQVLFESAGAKRMVGTVLDITERVNAERSIRESEERFRELANNIDQVVWTCDALGQPTWYNDRWYEYSGATFEQMLNEGWRSLVHPDHSERIGESFRRCISTGEIWEETFPVRGKKGEYRWFLSRAIPIKAPDGTVLRWFGSNTDITSQRELQEALTSADRRKDEFLAMLAHELRNPVAPIVNTAQILLRMWSGQKRETDLVSIVQRQAQHLAHLLDDLLDVARITRGRIELRREVINVNEFISLACETADSLLRSRSHRLEISRAPSELLVDVDKVRLTQCLTNLLSNAVKYSEAGTTIHIATYAREGQAVIEVRDAGRGIPADVLPHIFELFAQGHRTLDRKLGGLGIGLSVCKRLMELHGGTVSAYSEGEGRGATFTLSLPLKELQETSGLQQSSPAVVRLRVLVVDDNEDAADSLAILLQMSGHETKVLYSGEEALKFTAAFAPDVILLDIGLPGIDGYEVIRRLREQKYAGHVIAISGYGQPEDKKKALAAGFNTHIVKPVEPGMLENALAVVARQ